MNSKHNATSFVRKYQYNDDFFEKIDTEAKSYWLGFLCADGNVSPRSTNSLVCLSIHKNDLNHLQKYRDAVEANYPIHYDGNCCKLQIYSRKMGDDLTKLGCTPRKSLTVCFPTQQQVPDYLIRHFILGYFDGDGSAYKNHNGGVVFEIASGSFKFLVGVQAILYSQLGLDRLIEPTGKIFRIRYSRQESISNLYNYFYNDATIFLERKKNILAKLNR